MEAFPWIYGSIIELCSAEISLSLSETIDDRCECLWALLRPGIIIDCGACALPP